MKDSENSNQVLEGSADFWTKQEEIMSALTCYSCQ